MNLLLWNVQWGQRSGCRDAVARLIESEDIDVACLTEATTKFLPADERVIHSVGDYGYDDRGVRRKVALWSRQGWDRVELVGDQEMPAGRFVSGSTNGVRFVGVCIPWFFAHVTSGRRDRTRWEDHRTYLAGLGRVLQRYVDEGGPLCVLGDFNQRVPPTPHNSSVYPHLMSALGPSLVVRTADVRNEDGEALIDHVATTEDTSFHLERIVPRCPEDGRPLSDHDGVIGRLTSPRDPE